MKTDVALSFFHGLISCPVLESSSVSSTLTQIPSSWSAVVPVLTSVSLHVASSVLFCVTIGFWPLFRTDDEWPDQLSRVWGDAKL